MDTAKGPSSPSVTPEPEYHMEGVWSVYHAGTRTVMRPVTEKNFRWFCERATCCWSGDGFLTAESAVNDAARHQQECHPTTKDQP